METDEKTSARTSYHHGDLRAQLLEATRQLVEEKGPDRFSVSEACRRAGVSTAAPYKHFKDKEEMLHHIALAGMERQRQQMLEELSLCSAGTLDRVVAMGRVYIRFARAEPGVFRLMFGLSEDHADHCDMVQLGDDTFTVVQSEVAKCHGRDTIIESDVNEAFLLWSFVHGLSFLLIDGKLKDAKVPFDLETTLREVAERVVGTEISGG
ncbi:TetR/AcrR family transcriptional regulator [uncultured Roseobacter sp.]|uniref:TetR/AcrR family transcriptional regulator n=1 Tax=uncultured Roseobacter sp. TaxID=114847 RepID=UPI0026295B5B|nr:TetR/AcrR family transcriptional regulator [uncultured Roseobacter sp.]